LRGKIRSEIGQAVGNSAEAQAASTEMCAFYRDHLQPDASRTLAQYISLALNLGEPPKFELRTKEADLPPDAAYVLGFVPLLARFYEAAGLQAIWQANRTEYSALVDRFHGPVSNMLLSTDVYLRMPVSGYLGRQFSVIVEPMAAPGQVNSRNYGLDYFVVLAPERNGILNTEAIRHTYLHFILDPLMAKRGSAMKQLKPLLATVQRAPLDASFKSDIELLVTESLIRAVEARTVASGKQGEAARQKALQTAIADGFVLARYFYDALGKFEKGEVGLRQALPDWLYLMEVDVERKRAEQVEFARRAAPELMSATPGRRNPLDLAEQRLSAGDYSGAQKLAQQALDKRQGDAGRALFILAQAASLNGDAENARLYFQRTLAASRDPRILAWAYIYLGRMADMQEDRETALEHYRAALATGDKAPETMAAAQGGLEQPYEPRRPRE
jgi:tetratricopeptide (TPR) repeat protein